MAFREDTIKTQSGDINIMDYIPDDHHCYLIEEVVDRMDFSEWEDEHWDTPGNPSFHPRVILRPIILGYVDGLASGRAIARHVNTDMSYIYLCGSQKPNFRTINRFYKIYPEFIAEVLLEFVKYAKEKGLVKLNGWALDSTNVEANASSYNVVDENQMQAILNTIYEIIRNNEAEDELLGEDNDGSSIKFDPDSDEFEEEYKKAVEFAKKHLDGDKLKYPAKKQIKNALKNPEKKTLEKMENAYKHLQNSSQKHCNFNRR